MSNYRRMRVEGATYFFTVALVDRGSSVLVDNIDVLRDSYARTIIEQPVWSDAFVVLPDHLHAVWTLPKGDADFSTRWRKIKARFSHALNTTPTCNQSKVAKGERGIWQRRFWEHMIRDDRDYSNHMEYCWGNPVRHGLVEQVSDWPYSSFHRDVRRGIVPTDWT